MRASVKDYRLNTDRRRVHQNLTPIFKDDDEPLRFADFLHKMPWNYARDVPHEIIAAHWKFLRNHDENFFMTEGESHSLHHEGADSWIGMFEPQRMQMILRRVANSTQSPLQRVFVHDDDKFAIAVVYAKQENTKKPYPLDPPNWLGTFKRTIFNHRKQAHSISFDTVIVENSTLFRIEVRNSPQSIVIRKLFEIMQRHQIPISSFDIWSTFGNMTGSRKIKESHSVEIEVPTSLDEETVQSIKDNCYRYLVALLKIQSLFDMIGPAMIGPSSSHTAGACRIGQLSRNVLLALQEAGHFKKIESFSIRLYGSFRDTGPGHGTTTALGAGLKGYSADALELRTEGDLNMLLEHGIPWTDGNVPFTGFEYMKTEDDKKYIKHQGDCINIAEVVAKTDAGNFALTGFSTGGGIIEMRFINSTRLVPTITGKRDLWIGPPPMTSKIRMSRVKIREPFGVIKKIHPQLAPLDEISPMFNTFDEALEIAKETGKSLLTMAIEVESKLQGTNRAQIIESMRSLWHIMKSSVLEGLENQGRSPMGLSGGDSTKLMSYLKSRNFICFHTLASVYALASSEMNAQMGRIVACPTAGACGIIPGVMLAWLEVHIAQGLDPQELENQVIDALLVAAFIGMIFYDDIPTAGATMGCQAEIGIGAAMAAAAIVQLNGGSPEAVVHGAILTIKNCMGLVCDPVAGLVEVPCIKRNAMYANFAITAADMARAGIRSQIPPDQVVMAVKEVGETMHSNYKETARGGLATTLNGKDIARRFGDMCKGICSGCQH